MPHPITSRCLRYLLAILFTLPGTLYAENTTLTQAPMLSGMEKLVSYRCPPGQGCIVRCEAGPGQLAFERTDVRRLEHATSEKQWTLTLVFMDAVGQAHQSAAILPTPASCLFDNLRIDAVLPVRHGKVVWPAPEEEVIFDLVPDFD